MEHFDAQCYDKLFHIAIAYLDLENQMQLYPLFKSVIHKPLQACLQGCISIT